MLCKPTVSCPHSAQPRLHTPRPPQEFELRLLQPGDRGYNPDFPDTVLAELGGVAFAFVSRPYGEVAHSTENLVGLAGRCVCGVWGGARTRSSDTSLDRPTTWQCCTWAHAVLGWDQGLHSCAAAIAPRCTARLALPTSPRRPAILQVSRLARLQQAGHPIRLRGEALQEMPPDLGLPPPRTRFRLTVAGPCGANNEHLFEVRVRGGRGGGRVREGWWVGVLLRCCPCWHKGLRALQPV